MKSNFIFMKKNLLAFCVLQRFPYPLYLYLKYACIIAHKVVKEGLFTILRYCF